MIKDKIQKFLLTELYNTWEYTIPVDRKDYLLFDFYAFSLINTGKISDINLGPALEDGKKRLYDYLTEEFKYIVLFSLAAEFAHICGDIKPWPTGIYHTIFEGSHANIYVTGIPTGQSLVSQLSTKSVSILSQYLKNLGITPDSKKDYLPSRKQSYNAIKKLNVLPADLMNMFKEAFMSDWFVRQFAESHYGGKAWAMVADAYTKLSVATTQGEQMVAIDHVYDLEHNNGTLFTKIKEYSGDGGYKWIRLALDFKRNIRDSFSLYNQVSPGLRGPFAYALHQAGAGTVQSYLEKKVETKRLQVGDLFYLITDRNKFMSIINTSKVYTVNPPKNDKPMAPPSGMAGARSKKFLQDNFSWMVKKQYKVYNVLEAPAGGDSPVYYQIYYGTTRSVSDKIIAIDANLVDWKRAQ